MHGDLLVICRLLPAGDIGVVIQLGNDDFVPGLPTTANDAAEVERQRGHVHAKNDIIGRGCIQEGAHRFPCMIHHLGCFMAGKIMSAQIGVIFPQVVGHFLQHPLRNLRTARPIEKDNGFVIMALGQRTKLSPGEFGSKCHAFSPRAVRTNRSRCPSCSGTMALIGVALCHSLLSANKTASPSANTFLKNGGW
ncbi:hypothetical protein D3C81_564020 [compost metagenome]